LARGPRVAAGDGQENIRAVVEFYGEAVSDQRSAVTS